MKTQMIKELLKKKNQEHKRVISHEKKNWKQTAKENGKDLFFISLATLVGGLRTCLVT